MRLRSQKICGEEISLKKPAAPKQKLVSRADAKKSSTVESKAKQTGKQTPDLVKRNKEYLDTRTKGVLSFIIPVCIVGFFFWTEPKVCEQCFGADANKAWLDAARITGLYFFLWACKEVCLNLFKYWLMVKQFGISHEHFLLIIGPRGKWDGSEIPLLVETYTAERIKVMDAISRRAGHTLINISRIYFYTSIATTNQLRLMTAILQLPVISSLKFLTESGNNCKDLGRFVFQGSRVMDGQYGRFNLVVVNFWAYAGRIIMFQMLISRQTEEQLSSALFMLAFQPLLWGDTFGEVIGSFFGKNQFKVYGLGEVNKKSVEGTFAVFLSSFLSMIFVFYYLSDSTVYDRFGHPIFVFFYTSVIASIVEAAAPRSTDNFFLETGCLWLLLSSLKSST